MPVFKQWLLADKKKGVPVEDHFSVNEDHAPDLRKDEILCRALFLSVDPITRLYMTYAMAVGDVIPGRQVARIVESRNKDFPKGKLVHGCMGWQTYTVLRPDTKVTVGSRQVAVLENLPRQLDASGLPKSACLGALGLPGITAYLSLFKVCSPKAGENIVISSGAGQIGHLVGQMAKLKGLMVIGYTGDSDKASWLKTELGFDWVFNYKMHDVHQTLKIAAPHGVDIFIDSVGGAFHNSVMEHMTINGRVCILGTISLYNKCAKEIPLIPAQDHVIALKGLTIRGFNINQFSEEEKEEALDAVADWCKEGKVKPYEHVIEGFENMPKAFIDHLEGKYQGKVIVRI